MCTGNKDQAAPGSCQLPLKICWKCHPILNNLQLPLLWGHTWLSPLLLWITRKAEGENASILSRALRVPVPTRSPTCRSPHRRQVRWPRGQGRKALREDYPVLPKDKTMTDSIQPWHVMGPQWTAEEARKGESGRGRKDLGNRVIFLAKEHRTRSRETGMHVPATGQSPNQPEPLVTNPQCGIFLIRFCSKTRTLPLPVTLWLGTSNWKRSASMNQESTKACMF